MHARAGNSPAMYAQSKLGIKLGRKVMVTGEGRQEGQFRVRRAHAEDGGGILACLAAAFAPYRDEYTPGGFTDTVLTSDAAQTRLREMCLFVAEVDAQIVGTIGCQASGEEGHLRGMAVLPSWQGTGVAAALLHTAERELQHRQCRRVTLDTTDPLQRATRFYGKHGYRPSGRVRDFFGMALYEYVKPL